MAGFRGFQFYRFLAFGGALLAVRSAHHVVELCQQRGPHLTAIIPALSLCYVGVAGALAMLEKANRILRG